MERLRNQSRWAIRALVCVAACGPLAGCVERRYTIRTNVPGALAIVNGEEIGPTPVSRNFIFYGPRKITLIADGFETVDVVQPVRPPWWDNYVTEFFTELQKTDDRIGDIRGRGAMQAVEFVESGSKQPNAALTGAIAKFAAEQGVLVLTCGTYGNVIRFLPSLAIGDELLREGLQVVRHGAILPPHGPAEHHRPGDRRSLAPPAGAG